LGLDSSRCIGVVAALAAAVALAPGSSPAATHHVLRRPVLVEARLESPGGGRARVALRWSEPVRIGHPGRVRFLGASGPGRRGRLLSRRPGRVETFLVAGSVTEVHVLAGAGHGRGGPTRPAILPITTVPSPVFRPGGPTPPVVAPGGHALPPLSSAFLDSVGVNIHAGYLDTSYGNAGALERAVIGLGVHHVRDSACVSCTQERSVLLALAQAGIKTDFGTGGPGDSESLASQVDLLDGPMNPAVASIEGPNEYDSSGDSNWVAAVRSYQQELYRRVRAAPHLAGVPVLGPSLANPDDASALGDLSSWLDQGNLHPYPGDQVPDANLASQRHAETAVAGARGVAVTETGYTTGLAGDGGELPVSETAASAYIPRAVLDDFRAGITRTYVYELLDEKSDPAGLDPQQHFGLLHIDYSPKPAYQTLQALLGAVAPAQGAPVVRSLLDYQILEGPSDLRELLFQTATHGYALVLWRNVSVWDRTGHHDQTPSAETVVLRLGRGVSPTGLRRLDAPGPDAPPQPDQTGAVQVSVAGMPLVLDLHRP